MEQLSIDRAEAILRPILRGTATRDDFLRLSRAEQIWLETLPFRPRKQWTRFFKGTRWELESLIKNSIKRSVREEPMPEPENKEPVPVQDLGYTRMIQTEALTRLLVKKGIISEDELLGEVKVVNKERHEKVGKIGLS